jgi:hypothetical protein
MRKREELYYFNVHKGKNGLSKQRRTALLTQR